MVRGNMEHKLVLVLVCWTVAENTNTNNLPEGGEGMRKRNIIAQK